MARNRDIKIWKDKFYRELPPLYKCFWDYINDDCDNAGVWLVDPKVASICIGRKINLTKAMELFAERILISPCQQKWYITTFIQEKLNFDAAKLNATNKFQKSIIDLLNKHEVESFKGLASPSQGAIVNAIAKADVRASANVKGGKGENKTQLEIASEPQPETRNLKPETNITHIGEPGTYRLIVRSKYAGDPSLIIHDLRQHFANQHQLDDLTRAGWTDFDGFMKANPGAYFNEPDHLYNAYRSHCNKASPGNAKQSERQKRLDDMKRIVTTTH